MKLQNEDKCKKKRAQGSNRDLSSKAASSSFQLRAIAAHFLQLSGNTCFALTQSILFYFDICLTNSGSGLSAFDGGFYS